MITYNPISELSPADLDSLKKISAALKQSQKIAISTHVRPDGDSIGSGLALYEMLKQMGKEVHFCNADKAPFPLTRLPHYEAIEFRQVFPEAFDLLILLEGAAPCRNGQTGIADYFTINIDHHKTSSQDATLNWVDASAAAVAELIYMLGKSLPIRFTASIGFNLYAAIVSDTGSFKYSNTSYRSLYIAADLARTCGFDPAQVTDLIFNSSPLEKVRMLQRVLGTLQMFLDEQVAVISFQRGFMNTLRFEDVDSEDVVAIVRSIYGVKVTLFFKEVGEKRYRVSIRSRDDVDALVVADTFQGGGHKNAAGFDYLGGLEQGIESVLRVIKEKLGESWTV